MKGENGLRRTLLMAKRVLEGKKLVNEFLLLSGFALSPKETLLAYQIFLKEVV